MVCFQPFVPCAARSWLFWRNISFVKWLRAHSSVWLAISFTLCVCNLLISDRSMPQNQCIISFSLSIFCDIWLCCRCNGTKCHFPRILLRRDTCPVVLFLSVSCVSVCVSVSVPCILNFYIFFVWRNIHFSICSFKRKKRKKTHETNQQIKNKCSMRESQNLGPHKILHLAWNSIAWYWKSTESRWCVQRHSMILALCW